ncbi:MAG: DUF1631 family protein [Burkholderiales bacterium]
MGAQNDVLLARCIESARDTLSDVLGQSIDALGASFPVAPGGANLKPDTPSELAAHASALRFEIIVTFRRELDAIAICKIDEAKCAGRRTSGPAPMKLDDLALIDENVVEEEVALARLVQIAYRAIDDDVCFGLESRLGLLCETERLEGRANPIGPQTVFGALHRACAGGGASEDIQAALCVASYSMLAASLGPLYVKVNDYLSDQGLLPDLRYALKLVPAGIARPHPVIAPQALDLEALLAMTDALRGQTSSLRESVPIAHVARVVEAAEVAALMRTVDLRAVFNTVLAGPPQALRYGARLLANPENALYSQVMAIPVESAVTEMLTRSQGLVLVTESDPLRAMTARELVAPLDGLDASFKHPLDTLTSELVSEVFKFVFADSELPTCVKRELARLQIVAMKAALLDRSFFGRQEHPMRRMLSGIGRLAIDPSIDSKEGGPLEQALREVVDFLIAHFERDLLIFDIALDRLTTTVRRASQPAESRVAQLAGTLEARELIELARDDAVAQIEARIGTHAPYFVVRFLREVWVPYLMEATLAELDGEDNLPARLQTVDDLLWSVAPDRSGELSRLVAMLPKLIPALRRGIRVGGVSIETEEEFLTDLMEVHTGLLQAARRAHGAAGAKAPANAPLRSPLNAPASGPPVIPRARALPAGDRVVQFDEYVESPVNIAPRQAKVIPFPSIELGAIVAFHEGDQAVRRKLSWVSPKRTLYIFCSDASAPRSLSSAELAEALRTGRIKRIEDDGTVIDRAMHAATGSAKAA